MAKRKNDDSQPDDTSTATDATTGLDEGDEGGAGAAPKVRLRNNHFAGAGYVLRDSELGPAVRFNETDGQEQEVTAAQAEYLLGEKYKRVHDNGREELLPRFARA